MSAATANPADNLHGHCFTPDRRWSARMELDFAVRQGRTTLAKMQFSGPLRVQQPFYPEAAPTNAPGRAQASRPCHCCLLHPPGGLVSGDDLSLAVRLEQGAHALITAPSASKFYAADTHNVPQRQTSDLAVTGGMLEWLPRETIIYDGARAEMRTSVELDNASACIGWEMICLGRPAANERFTHGSVRQSLILTREGLPLLHEVLRFEGGGALQECACGLRGQAVSATLFAVGRGADDGQDLAALEACCAALQDRISPCRDFDAAPDDTPGGTPDGTPGAAPRGQSHAVGDSSVQAMPAPLSAHMRERAGATVRGEALVVRYLGPDMEEARNLLLTAWNMLRPALTGCPPHMPRIWHGAF
ncbi:urease accessory protein UreD [Desulfovibrio sp. 86]|uniref:Putative Urease accessory protein UreD n=1 Tax=uncultured Desulfovibrio sp. TaxID=167968 RepID=A0A212L8Q9_9BACT|nr:urease accessory protein UreD [Desulfovibrio sp. 86]SCM73867.1 putative Urease accessory protein UreD [uncultured Desulfovibrio sp.]VZH34485.1 Urease accessory protein UreD [Desulfovibrio sp. 86]